MLIVGLARGGHSRYKITLAFTTQQQYKLREADIKKLTVNEPKLLDSITPAFQKYNEEQLTTVKLPGSSKNVSNMEHTTTE